MQQPKWNIAPFNQCQSTNIIQFIHKTELLMIVLILTVQSKKGQIVFSDQQITSMVLLESPILSKQLATVEKTLVEGRIGRNLHD